MATDNTKLLDAEETIEAIFTEKTKPGLRTWYRWQKEGKFPSFKIGRRTFYDVDLVRRALTGASTTGVS